MAQRVLRPARENRMHQAVRSVFIKWLSELGDWLMDYSLVVDEEMFINGSFHDVELGLLPIGSLTPLCVVKIAFNEPREKWRQDTAGLVCGAENECRILVVVEICEEPDENRPPPPEKELWSSLPFMHRHNVGQLAATIQAFCIRKEYYLSGRFTCKVHLQCLRWHEPELLWECEMTRDEVISHTEEDEDMYPNWRNILLPEWDVKGEDILLPFEELLEAMWDCIEGYDNMVALRMAGVRKGALEPAVEECQDCRLCERHIEPLNRLQNMYKREAAAKQAEEMKRKAEKARKDKARLLWKRPKRSDTVTRQQRDVAEPLCQDENGQHSVEEMSVAGVDDIDEDTEEDETGGDEGSEYEDDGDQDTDMSSD
ncbi:hypothetical protein CPC735_057050 [Coccidioides posadasii C735 delta SOWgp]|uniref:Uncharacterized protein n=4 Tax=Coccidioides posadasii TaxID=199306 RepID=E9DJ36_COCPS|nr:hypothetical protein CPC735_057050 [Coccidioides posadasii C735 delta SOWgp]EER24335.1 hypothetical protein CPC735_057050 [Coccidioides posadasii C735 delta SOWgp]EFW13621.1 conserved hypothetical protein [Coccidioides posadasii str. Silveira]KMM66017.1 hypothetical protein CPAG_02358 [Coccidioides posadasii RMSCC 3488]|eukprot:XP_003066480.1 hypothetical protein CPC735_057050 [Coccidioides posadasii C735 delta SOWgp]